MKHIAIGLVTGLAVWFAGAVAAEAQQITPTGPLAVRATDTSEVYTATISNMKQAGWFILKVLINGNQVYGGQWYINSSGPSYDFTSPVLSTASWGLAPGQNIDFQATYLVGVTFHVTQDYNLTVQSGGTTMAPSSRSEVMLAAAVPSRKEEAEEVVALDDRRSA